jgi:DNA-binding MarR family transcriptional regulator
MKKTSRVVTNAYDKILAPSRLTTGQYALLRNIDQARVISLGDLARHLQLDQTSTTRSVALLESDGLITRTIHHDPRVKLLKLTGKGKQRLKHAHGLWKIAHSHMEKYVSDQDWQSFTKTLRQIEAGAASINL